ncbi:MAG: hypothetical protein COV44_09780 [Deltaproteobacteria bacterium CG11_big_fil_rev_8_21_14_0_20_45_16]|nr:MAG: hypothetical protein COV44_09780 [Deltaproteobacteria bacterium CG11_big_fil_rev_8_21_14_0_20_45_16]
MSQLDWKENLTPINRQFDDIYYADEDGLAEARYVYLLNNSLPEKWKPKSDYAIAELGFGTGLNFFAVLDLWFRNKMEDSKLRYSSCEKFPLTGDDITKALSRWPELQPQLKNFLTVYDPQRPGFQKIKLSTNVELDLFIGDVSEFLSQLQSPIDTWFLDGFAPRKNPEMWSDEVFDRVLKLSSPSASFATFAAAGFIRRGMLDRGFQVSKVAGFGRKREMLRGHLA